jgi:exosortase
MTINSCTCEKDNSNTSSEELSWSSLGSHVYVKTAIIAGLTYWFFYNQIYSIVHKWINEPSWSHGFLIPLFSLYFINQHKDELLSLKPRTNYLGLACLIFCILFFFANRNYIHIGYLNSLLIIFTIGSVVLFLGGWKLLKYTWLPIGYLFFAIPLPSYYYSKITIPMRIFAAQIAEALLNIIPELQATSSGVVIDVIYKGKALEPSLDVAEACSGMRLLMAFLALGVAMAYLHKRPVIHRIVLLMSTVPIAIFCNVVRVTVTCFIYLWNAEYAKGIYHDMLGMLMLPLAFGLYGGLAWFMSNLFVTPVKEEPTEDLIIRKKEITKSDELNENES